MQVKYANTTEHCKMLRNDATQSVVQFILHDKHKNSNFFFKRLNKRSFHWINRHTSVIFAFTLASIIL